MKESNSLETGCRICTHEPVELVSTIVHHHHREVYVKGGEVDDKWIADLHGRIFEQGKLNVEEHGHFFRQNVVEEMSIAGVSPLIDARVVIVSFCTADGMSVAAQGILTSLETKTRFGGWVIVC